MNDSDSEDDESDDRSQESDEAHEIQNRNRNKPAKERPSSNFGGAVTGAKYNGRPSAAESSYSEEQSDEEEEENQK